MTIFPTPRRCPPAGDSHGKDRGASAGSGRGYEGDLSRIGDYHGEPLKLIHWKLSARQDELKVRELSAAVREPLLIDPTSLPGTSLEERLQCATYLVNRCLREGRPVGLRLGGRTIAAARSHPHKIRLLSELANHAAA